MSVTMAEDRLGRRTLLGAGAGLLATLSGCGRLFVEPEATATPGASTPAATETATPAPTERPEPTATPAPTAAPLPADDVAIRNRRLAVRRSRLEQYAFVLYGFDVENVGDRTIRDVEFRVSVRYEHDEFSRIVASAYPRFVFDPSEGSDDDGSDETREGLQPEETDSVFEEVRFERDGRAQRSTEPERFALELSVRRLRYL
jgi:hypothetical protein